MCPRELQPHAGFYRKPETGGTPTSWGLEFACPSAALLRPKDPTRACTGQSLSTLESTAISTGTARPDPVDQRATRDAAMYDFAGAPKRLNGPRGSQYLAQRRSSGTAIRRFPRPRRKRRVQQRPRYRSASSSRDCTRNAIGNSRAMRHGSIRPTSSLHCGTMDRRR